MLVADAGRWSARLNVSAELFLLATVALFRRWSRRTVWAGMLFGTTVALVFAVLPPFLSAKWRAIVMHAFSPVCHQISARSPFFGGVQIAVCDRCIGIYFGLVLGVATIGMTRRLWRALGRHGRFVFLGSLVPLGIDWIGPALGLWANAPTSRAVTGLLFGVVAGSFVTHQVLAKVVRPTESR